jgi:hypothetical protein
MIISGIYKVKETDTRDDVRKFYGVPFVNYNL